VCARGGVKHAEADNRVARLFLFLLLPQLLLAAWFARSLLPQAQAQCFRFRQAKRQLVVLRGWIQLNRMSIEWQSHETSSWLTGCGVWRPRLLLVALRSICRERGPAEDMSTTETLETPTPIARKSFKEACIPLLDSTVGLINAAVRACRHCCYLLDSTTARTFLTNA